MKQSKIVMMLVPVCFLTLSCGKSTVEVAKQSPTLPAAKQPVAAPTAVPQEAPPKPKIAEEADQKTRDAITLSLFALARRHLPDELEKKYPNVVADGSYGGTKRGGETVNYLKLNPGVTMSLYNGISAKIVFTDTEISIPNDSSSTSIVAMPGSTLTVDGAPFVFKDDKWRTQ